MGRERSSRKPGNFQQLLQRAVKGDRRVFEELLHPFQKPLHHYCRLLFPKELEGKIDVSDVVQETLWRAWQSFHSFHGKTGQVLVSWLQVILRHVIDDYLRVYHGPTRDIRREVPLRRHEVPTETPEFFPAEEETLDEVRKFRAVFPRLPKRYRQVLYLRKYQELSYKEIAARLGGTPEGARKLHERALRRFMAEWRKS